MTSASSVFNHEFFRVKKKGVSPLIATVLLIAFTIAVAGIISVWLTQFTKQQTNLVTTQGNTQVQCGTAGISLRNVQYCSNYISGQIINSGSIGIGNVTITLLYYNASRESWYLQDLVTSLTKSSTCCGNLSMSPGSIYSFNFSIGGTNYDIVRVTTNCTTTRVSDEATVENGRIALAC